MRWLPPTFGFIVLGCALAFLLLWWVLLGAGRNARRRALDARIQLWEQTHPPPAAATLQALRHAARAARGALCGPGRRQALYRRPWVLFIGDPAADLLALLATAHPAGPIEAEAADTGDAFWRWWLMDGLAAIEVCPPPVAPTLAQDALWFRALRELALHRPRLPLNAVALCVSAGTLRLDPSVARPIFALLCRRIRDTASGLRVRVPVYIVVTGLQRLPGYAAVRAALPAEALARALGHCADGGETLTPDDAAARLERAFAPLVLRLQALRMGLVRQTADPAERAAIHGFVEEVQALAPGLALLMERLAQSGDERHPLPWRGLYLTASGAEGAFVDDLFQRFMPADQGLARPLP